MIPTIIVCLIIGVALFFAVRHIVKQRGTCGCGCADCPSRGSCHSIEKALKKSK